MRILRVFLQIIVILNVEEALANDVLGNAELYAKCYAKLTDHPVELDSADYKKVAAGTLNPVAACMKALNKAMFVKSGNKRTLPNPNDEVSQSILRNFNAFHQSWFTNNFSADGGTTTTAAFLDMSAPALYITDALFSKSHFKSIVTSKETLQGIRNGGNPATYVINGANRTGTTPFIARMNYPNVLAINDYYAIPDSKRINLGVLTGIQRAPAQVLPLPAGLGLGKNPLTDAQQAAHRLEVKSYDINKHYGGGLLGTPANFYTNDEGIRSLDGGLKVHRRWANNTFYDLMCAKLPTFNKSDDPAVVAEYKKFNAAGSPSKSHLSFRQNKTCLGCHVTLDNFAHAARNVEERLVSDGGVFLKNLREAYPDKKFTSVFMVFSSPVTKPMTPIVDEDPYYVRRPPQGRLVYRDFNGNPVDDEVTGLQDLGEKIATHDDIYMCAAKRYYAFFTGIDVSMAPIPVDPKTKKISDADKFDDYHRKIVLGLSKKLKENGSMSGMIQSILNTKAFKARNPATVEK